MTTAEQATAAVTPPADDLDAYVAHLVAQAPPPSPALRDRLRQLLRPPDAPPPPP